MKNDILELFQTMYEAHDELEKFIEKKDSGRMEIILADLQDMAVQIGTAIERSEGEGFITVRYLEEYCETVYEVSQGDKDELKLNGNKVRKALNKKLIKAENSVKADIRIKLEIVFISYKAAMWDSLESVWRSAALDPDCDAYVIPVPYYDRNPDKSLGQFHYEGDEYPDDVPVTHYEAYDLAVRRPDVIYFYNPYDEWNLVTSVDPRFYSSNLRQYTECLVYIPYYVTSGSMSEWQKTIPAYFNVDYIVIQSPAFRAYFDERIPDEKFLPFGSPKFDKVIQKCQNPPQPPKEWTRKMEGRKVYFYNTSIGGMLADTESFLKKMEYVFRCFEGREDACLLWRPHPLLESTLDSMRTQYRYVFDALKRCFIENNLGIFDTTADIEDTIALSDAYIGDEGTSVISLFGVVGKPVFILNNQIHDKPDEENWRGEVISFGFHYWEQHRFAVVRGNKLYVSEPYKYEFHYFCDLSDGDCDGFYSNIYEIDGKWYACPWTAKNILVIGEKGVEKTIGLENICGDEHQFRYAWKYKQYLILVSHLSPVVVRYDTETGVISCFNENKDIFVKEEDGTQFMGGSMIYHGYLYIASPLDNKIYQMDIESGVEEVIELPIKSRCGCFAMMEYQGNVWLMPYRGFTIVRWNPVTGETEEFDDIPDELACKEAGPAFNIPAFYGDNLYFAPCKANMYLKLDVNTGKFTIWQPFFEGSERNKIPLAVECSSFFWEHPDKSDADFKIYSYLSNKLYSVNLDTGKCQKVQIHFDMDEIRGHESGFCEYSEKVNYVCMETHLNSLDDFLDGNIAGQPFNKERQLEAFRQITADFNGRCGERTHEFVKKGVINK